ncbi:hypothetical protein [Atlantibacter hermannii]|uniref:hypothetical protein n=1 Tax=Atlantibacter hermannii TaxID=565 RepID=UPI0028A180F8|nr:hypothetical protein [Atlantibacter hermannii]
MGNQTIKITGLDDYGPITAALQDEYNGLQSNASKRRLMLDCLRNGYALEEMGLGGLVDLLERQNFIAMSEAERRKRFIGLIGALIGELPASPAPAPAPASANVPVNEVRNEPVISQDNPPALKTGDATATHSDDDMSTTRVERSPTNNPPSAIKLRNRSRKQ